MKKAIILHGTMGSPEINWFRWLESELKNKDFAVEIPQLPTPEDQNLENWLKVVDQYSEDLKNGAILIGHSLGATCALKYLEQADIKIKEVYLVSPVIDFIDLEDKDIENLFNNLNSTFVKDELDWDKIAKNLEELYTFHGSNDPYVPLWHAECIQDNLGGELEVIKNGGHLNSEFGYDKFEKLLENIKG